MVARSIMVAMALVLIGAWSLPAMAVVSVDFEQGITRDMEPIGDLIPGLRFSTTTGGDVYFGYIGDGAPYTYLWKSDNGKEDPQWEFWMGGDCAAYVANVSDVAVISFMGNTADFFSVGYSIGRSYEFSIQAYDAAGYAIGSAVTGAPQCREEHANPPGLAYLSLSYENMASVRLYGSPACGGCWVIDNIAYGPSSEVVPERSALALAAFGLLPVLRRRR